MVVTEKSCTTPRYYCWLRIVTTDETRIFYGVFSYENRSSLSLFSTFPEGKYAEAMMHYNNECARLERKWYGDGA